MTSQDAASRQAGAADGPVTLERLLGVGAATGYVAAVAAENGRKDQAIRLNEQKQRADGAPGLSAGQASEALSELTLQFLLRRADDVGLGDEDDVPIRPGPPRAAAERLPEAPLGGVPHDGAAHVLADGQAHAIVAEPVGEGDEHEEPPVEPDALAEHLPEGRCRRQPIPSRESRSRAVSHRTASGPDSLSALLTTPLQHQATPLGPHAHEESVGAVALPVVRLERPLHRWTLPMPDKAS